MIIAIILLLLLLLLSFYYYGGASPAAGQAPAQGPARAPPSPFRPGRVPDVAVLIGSGGFASSLGEAMGMRTLETESLRKESAIGLVCNIVRTRGKGESKLRSFSMVIGGNHLSNTACLPHVFFRRGESCGKV